MLQWQNFKPSKENHHPQGAGSGGISFRRTSNIPRVIANASAFQS
ncbi:hypothetical protein Z950_3747 [Sulfitobacter mediterraneus KCTC 32188]|nr:hypothetical protein Z950_3747 [Sulfitobacter mediterraneus KCTC 32188]